MDNHTTWLIECPLWVLTDHQQLVNRRHALYCLTLSATIESVNVDHSHRQTRQGLKQEKKKKKLWYLGIQINKDHACFRPCHQESHGHMHDFATPGQRYRRVPRSCAMPKMVVGGVKAVHARTPSFTHSRNTTKAETVHYILHGRLGGTGLWQRFLACEPHPPLTGFLLSANSVHDQFNSARTFSKVLNIFWGVNQLPDATWTEIPRKPSVGSELLIFAMKSTWLMFKHIHIQAFWDFLMCGSNLGHWYASYENDQTKNKKFTRKVGDISSNRFSCRIRFPCASPVLFLGQLFMPFQVNVFFLL